MRIVFIVASLWLATINISLLHFTAGLSWELSLTDGLLNSAMISLSMWAVMLIVNSYPTQVAAMIHALLFATLLAAAITFTNRFALKWWVKNDTKYIEWLYDTTYVRLFITWIVLGWAATITARKKQTDMLEEKFLKHKDADELVKDAELFKLRQQLQPHFLYNSLNSISALVMIQPDKAQEMIGKLSDFLRNSVKKEAEDLIPIQEELSFIEAYLSIEAIRFGDRLHVDFTQGNIDEARIPPFLLQPLLENAIKFGLYGKTGNVTIGVDIKLEEKMLRITISNPYDAQAANPKGTGFGLQGIRRRLELLYARADLLEIKKEEETFTTILKIPQAYA